MRGMTYATSGRRGLLQGASGLLMIGVFWTLNWSLDGLRTHVLFFPLWFGYILTVDAAVRVRTGSSLLARDPRRFGLCFLVSIPLWWFFELINLRTANWFYLGAGSFAPLTYALLASVAFSTVVPAILETAELMTTFRWSGRLIAGPRLPPPERLAPWLFAAGWLMLALVLLWPEVCYPLTWGAAYAIVEPMNAWRGRPTLIARLHAGNWQPLVALSTGALLCGLFWELWNYGSYPRWTYRTPGADFLHVFEMPLLGYLGYLPFAWEVYAFTHLLMSRAPELRLNAQKAPSI